MNTYTQFAQATYNCTGASDSTYGAGAFGSCDTTASTPGETTQNVGTPDTGTFLGALTSGNFSVILPLVVATVVIATAVIVIVRKKRAARRS